MTDMKRQSISLPDELVDAIAVLKERMCYEGTDSGLYRRLIEIGLRTLDINPAAHVSKREARLTNNALSLAETFDNVLDDAGRRFIKNAISHEVSRVTGTPI